MKTPLVREKLRVEQCGKVFFTSARKQTTSLLANYLAHVRLVRGGRDVAAR
jgi:hypothetical protein